MTVDDEFADALAHHEAGRLDLAEAGYRALLARHPDHPHANNNLAVLLRATRRQQEAAAHYRRAITARPEDAAVRNNFACALEEQGHCTEAIATARVALSLHPGKADGWFNTGNMLTAYGDLCGAMAAYQRAVRLDPAMAGAYSNLGDAQRRRGELSLAILSYRTAIRLQPDLPQPIVNLGEALKDQGRVTEAIAVLQDGLERHPALPLLHSNLLLALHYSPLVPPEVIARAHAHWNDRHARGLGRCTPFANDRTAERRLRVGYVSPDFCEHACAGFIEPLLHHHDRGAVEVVGYPTSRRQDGTTERMRRLTDAWHPLTGLDEDAAARRIEQDRIDILVDLAAHTAGGRLLLFARKPAPIQVTWLGYPDGTGMPAMDYRLTDAVADPPGETDGWHAERLVRLPNGFLAFTVGGGLAPPAPPPVQRNGFVTFGSFNTVAKLTPTVLRLWSEILTALPSSRLLLKSAAFADGPTRDNHLRRFARHGVAAERLDLQAQVPSTEEHLRLYDRVDIALDPFPYNGTTTTCEALKMGVPVVTLAGRHHVARVGASLLTRCGLADLVADSESRYVAAALALARDLPRLSALRLGMRNRLERSPLGDPRGFARSVEAAYRTMWRRWVDSG
ncbi:O-linked N-acetylglucosamine transferase, SPINDLY family protein [Azospirillum picis]|uniref:protein O-GlcNAc transferase n=1 Tax=Azospirillum picis TaxID=488438 RepID=A0ABU0MTP9_9PROT|nr:tetratricopeptide repeat protein [Azospirillum picis]MBP2302740.1 putative O-linked N-acetylglucosamine transferase (SPINDLY family) [Azospirillum picis]MDQ0536491.1 putative O-linked N-acetylglucosamine transferase (SPINDLY family) [Azospirillum picis]